MLWTNFAWPRQQRIGIPAGADWIRHRLLDASPTRFIDLDVAETLCVKLRCRQDRALAVRQLARHNADLAQRYIGPQHQDERLKLVPSCRQFDALRLGAFG